MIPEDLVRLINIREIIHRELKRLAENDQERAKLIALILEECKRSIDFCASLYIVSRDVLKASLRGMQIETRKEESQGLD